MRGLTPARDPSQTPATMRGLTPATLEETTYADLCTVVRDEIEHRLVKGENLPKPTVRATRDLDFAAV